MTSPNLNVATLLLTRGARRSGELVTPLAHALQCAALARRGGADDELVLAALLHDIGHLVGGLGGTSEAGLGAGQETPAHHHGQRAARLIGPYVPERVAWVVEHHVTAKRYLCAMEPRYASSLSPASMRSLAAQGGPLDAEACRAFERARWFGEALALRRWDDLANDPEAVVSPLDAYGPLLSRPYGPLLSRYFGARPA